MAVSSVYAPLRYTGNGTTVSFPFYYPFFAATDLDVLLYDTSAGALVSPQPVLNGGAAYDYAVTGTVDASTGEYTGGATVVFNTAPLATHLVVLQRAVPATQPVSLSNTAPFPAKSIEAGLDRIAMAAQQAAAEVATSIQMNPADAAGFTLPTPQARAGQLLGFDSSGNPTTVALAAGTAVISSAMQPVVSAATTAAAASLLLQNGYAAAGDVQFPSVSGGPVGPRSRVRNGVCRYDRRNSGALQTAVANNAFVADGMRFQCTQAGKFNAQQNLSGIPLPPGYANFLGLKVASAATLLSSDFFMVGQRIEGQFIDDLVWGSGSAKPVTVLAMVYSSVAGIHSGTLRNSGSTQVYPFTFTIPTANAWTRVAIPVPGAITGTWLGGLSIGIELNFNLGSGSGSLGAAGAWSAANVTGVSGAVQLVTTANAVFAFTGLELRDGAWTAAAAPEWLRPDLDLLFNQRYFNTLQRTPQLTTPINAGSAITVFGHISFPAMRTGPTIVPAWGAVTNFTSYGIADIGADGFDFYGVTASSGAYANLTLAGASMFAEI